MVVVEVLMIDGGGMELVWSQKHSHPNSWLPIFPQSTFGMMVEDLRVDGEMFGIKKLCFHIFAQ